MNRAPIFAEDWTRSLLRSAIDRCRVLHPFSLDAIVLLPDHLHLLMSLPPADDDYPRRLSNFKAGFTRAYLTAGGAEQPRSASRNRQRTRGVWLKRYWEHTVRDEDDLKRCVDYTHWNPRKHKLAARVRDWEWSSFNRLVQEGEYDLDWGGTDPTPGWDAPEWGE